MRRFHGEITWPSAASQVYMAGKLPGRQPFFTLKLLFIEWPECADCSGDTEVLKYSWRDKINCEKSKPVIARWCVMNCTAKPQVTGLMQRLTGG